MYDENKIRNSLYAAADAVYRDFNSSLITTVDKNCVIGVRTPRLRTMAKNMIKSGMDKDFIQNLPHKFFEENQLHAFVVSQYRDFDVVVRAVDKFLPYVDNWATCDQLSPKVFVKNAEKLLPYIKKWIKSKHAYTVRFGVLCLMRYFLDNDFDTKYADMVLNIKSDEYYVNMMRAWYFATGAINHFDDVVARLDKLDAWTLARAIQKSIESRRVSAEHKDILRKMRASGVFT